MTSSTAFPNGVASGDITNNSVVLWTRSAVAGDLTFEVVFAPFDDTTDPFADEFAFPITRTATVSDVDVPVRVKIPNLFPGFFPTDYVYRVTNAEGDSIEGSFTLPATPNPGFFGNFDGLRFGAFADWQGQLAPFTSISNAVDRDLDFFITLGDTVYADVETPALPGVSEASTLAEFRIKHNEVYSDRFGRNTFADLRASAFQLSTWDDHEIINDFAGGAVIGTDAVNDLFEGSDGTFVNDTRVFDNGLKAFRQFNPIRSKSTGDTGDDRTANELDLYRYNTFGNDAATFVLDTRSFRDAPLSPPGASATDEERQDYFDATFNPDRTLLGAAQLDQFKADLLAADAAGIEWKFVMSSVPMQNFGLAVAGERWEGYAAERAELLAFIEDNDIDNVVFVSADFHGNVINNVTYQETSTGPQISTGVFDVMVGPVAYEIDLPFLLPPFNEAFGAPYGPATAAFSFDPDIIADYTALDNNTDRDQFIKDLVDDQLTELGYSPIGLEDSDIRARVVEGDYINAHSFGWTEFDIDPFTQALTISSYGIDPYTSAELEADPDAIAARTPTLINQIVVRSSTFDRLIGEDTDDSLIGSVNEDLIRGLAGDDTLWGDPDDDATAGRGDRIAGGLGNDSIFGGAGGDTLQGQRGDDVINGDVGDDFITGGAGDDQLQGGDGDDFLQGNNGNDVIEAGPGFDILYGDSGDDTLDGGSGSDFIEGNEGNDRITGGGGFDDLAGGRGADVLMGNAKDDFLFGDNGPDQLIGGSGDDFLLGGQGSDTLTGGEGLDTFGFDERRDRLDTIRDFVPGEDLIDLSFIFFGDQFGRTNAFRNYVQLISYRDNVLIGIAFDGDDNPDVFEPLVILEQVDVTDLSRQDFLI